jgi:hypothetical protein
MQSAVVVAAAAAVVMFNAPSVSTWQDVTQGTYFATRQP